VEYSQFNTCVIQPFRHLPFAFLFSLPFRSEWVIYVYGWWGGCFWFLGGSELVITSALVGMGVTSPGFEAKGVSAVLAYGGLSFDASSILFKLYTALV